MTITIYNEAGEVVTDVQEQARRLQAEFGPGEVRIYGDDGELLAVRKSGPLLDSIMKRRRCALARLADNVFRR